MALCTDAYGAYVDCTDPTAMFPVNAQPVGPSVIQQHQASGLPMTTITFAILIATACLVLCVKLARHKGYGTGAGVLMGLLLPVIGVIFFALVPPKTPSA